MAGGTPVRHRRSLLTKIVFCTSIALIVLAFSYSEDIRAYGIARLHAFVQALGIDAPRKEATSTKAADELRTVSVRESEFDAVYKRLAIEPLPIKLEREDVINQALTRLLREACDKEAIFSFSEALRRGGNLRIAGNAYFGFGASCSNGEGEKHASAQIFNQLADYDRAIMIMTDVISANTANGQYRYLRGLALVGAKRYDEALTDYANAIELFDNQRDIGEWVFVERPPRPAAPSSG